jgi:hydroxyacylglutathione hydrolase
MKELLPGLRQLGDSAPDGSCGATYVVGEGSELALVDAGTAANYPYLKSELASAGVRPQDIKYVFITHGHPDHYEGAVSLRGESDATVFVGEADRRAVATGDYWLTGGFFYARHPLLLPETTAIGTGYELRLGSITLRAIETPGHSKGSMTYEVEIPRPDALVALLGDTGWGGWHEKIGSDLEVWKESAGNLCARPYTHVSFGHGTNELVIAQPHLTEMYEQIGTYGNAYDDIPLWHFNEELVLAREAALLQTA